ncbi:MAG: LPS export ABC transporter periplasmic protein LptC [Treponema sp.]|jgi:LPS export ABC transporter protein LptC|nr:LPS export ABC transporter periplasmic protein LptC [Treponema sp.]
MLKRTVFRILLLLILLFWVSCTFDYGQNDGSDEEQPDLVMNNVEYVRVRSADIQARFHAELAERYEKKRKMELTKLRFEQYGEHGNEINAFGTAGYASVDIDSGDISMRDGVRIEVESEDITIETERLEWLDENRTLSVGEKDTVNIFMENGTSFKGIGFNANARSRKWEFKGTVSGTYIYDDEEDE